MQHFESQQAQEFGNNAHVSIPVTPTECGLPQTMLEDIVARQMFETGVVNISTLSLQTALAGRLLESVIDVMRADARVEVLGPGADSSLLRYSLTQTGRQFASDAKERSGYIGPAPVSEAQYCDLIHSQSVKNLEVTRHEMHEAYNDVVITPQLQDRLGTAIHSGKAIFIYGPAGTGKTFLCSRLIRLLRTPVYIPHAVAVGDSIVRVFDASVHQPVEEIESGSPWISDRTDPRFVLCNRPFLCSGGELTMDDLEIRRDAATGQYNAPLQMKAIHGIYMIDDLGRQKMPTDALFNRWIVPMESESDYLNLESGARLVLPFDVILIFSTNLLPEDLDDPAFQRRIGHKIGFDYCDNASYAEIWRRECQRHGLECDENLIEFAIHNLHQAQGTPMLACHPRDLVGMALDYARYDGYTNQITQTGLELAWNNYFARSG